MPYPPGIPVIIPGERIMAELLDYLSPVGLSPLVRAHQCVQSCRVAEPGLAHVDREGAGSVRG